MKIGSDNSEAGWCSIQEAVIHDTSYCVLPRGDLLVLDADDEVQAAAVWEIQRSLIDGDCRPVMVESGRPGNVHLFCIIDDPDERAYWRVTAKRSGVDTRSTGGDRIRPPLTRHRSGLPVTLLYPETVEEAVDHLRVSPGPDVHPLSTAKTLGLAEPRLTDATWKLLRWGDPAGDQSAVVMRIVTGAVAVSYPKDKLLHLLETPANLGGEGLRSRGEHGRTQWFTKLWRRAEEYVAANPTVGSRDEAVALVQSMWGELPLYRWTTIDLPAAPHQPACRVSGDCLRRTMIALLELSLDMSTLTPYASQYFLHDLSGVERKTVRKALRGLEALGWIKRTSPGKGLKATRYKLLPEGKRQNPPQLTHPGGVRTYGGTEHVGHDVFQRGGGIGNVGWRILHVPEFTVGLSVKDISVRAGAGESSVRRSLNNMAKAGLVRKVGRTWYRNEDIDLDAAAVSVGTAGKAVARKAKNDAKRASQARKVETWRQRRLHEESDEYQRLQLKERVKRQSRATDPLEDVHVDQATGEILTQSSTTASRSLSPASGGADPCDQFGRLSSPELLKEAWRVVKGNHGAAGIDGVTVSDIEEAGVDEVLATLSVQLRNGTYHPRPPRTVEIPKSDGSPRKLHIPTVLDRVVQAAMKIVVEPVFESTFHDTSYGFRKGRSTRQAVDRIARSVEQGRHFILEADIEGYFDAIDHQRLLALVEEHVHDRHVVALVRDLLDSGSMELGSLDETEVGVPQGGVISPLLSNIYLNRFDHDWAASGIGDLVRYADDFVVVCSTLEEADEARRQVATLMEDLGLTLHPGKTRVVDLHEGIDFLGFRLWVGADGTLRRSPSHKNVARVKEKLERLMDNRDDCAQAQTIANVNGVLRGWSSYFDDCDSAEAFEEIDRFVIDRLDEPLDGKVIRLAHLNRSAATVGATTSGSELDDIEENNPEWINFDWREAA